MIIYWQLWGFLKQNMWIIMILKVYHATKLNQVESILKIKHIYYNNKELVQMFSTEDRNESALNFKTLSMFVLWKFVSFIIAASHSLSCQYQNHCQERVWRFPQVIPWQWTRKLVHVNPTRRYVQRIHSSV